MSKKSHGQGTWAGGGSLDLKVLQVSKSRIPSEAEVQPARIPCLPKLKLHPRIHTAPTLPLSATSTSPSLLHSGIFFTMVGACCSSWHSWRRGKANINLGQSKPYLQACHFRPRAARSFTHMLMTGTQTAS